MKKLCLLFLCLLSKFSFSQTGTVGDPFTSLKQASSVSSAGVYFFNLTGTTFSTYVDNNGWTQVAIDFGSSAAANLPQGTSLTNSARGILSPAVLLKLSATTIIRITSSTGNINATSINATLISRVINNATLHGGTPDNAINDSWTGTGAANLATDATSGASSLGTTLEANIFHPFGANTFHWISGSGYHREIFGSGEVVGTFQLWVKAPQYPGGVSGNSLLWLKAGTGAFSDAGITTATNGGTIQQWNDQSGTGKNAIQATAGSRPTYFNTTNLMNYNPVIRFSGAQQMTTVANVFTTGADVSYDFFIASSINNTTGSSQCIFSQGTTNGGQQNTTMGYNNGLAVIHNWPSSGFTSGTTVALNKPNITEFNYDQSATLRNTLLQGTSLGTTNTSGLPLNLLGTSIIGAHAALPDTRFFLGDAPEIIAYADFKNATDRSKIQSYLAIKYGSTLSNSGGGTNGDYLSSAGTTIWDADNVSGYQNNIIGIGRDDNSSLLQKQSKQPDDSTRIYLSTLAATNTANAGTFASSDNQFVLIGNNAARMFNNTANKEFPLGVNIASRFDREWKITNTAFTGTFSLDIKPETGTYVAGKIKVLVDADGDFSNATVIMPTVTFSSGVITLSGITTSMIPAGTRYITLAFIASPGGVSTNLSLWLKANDAGSFSDAGSTGAIDGGTVQQWNDQSGTVKNATQATAGSRPVYYNGTTHINYNPILRFSGAQQMTTATNVFTTGADVSYDLFTVSGINGTTGSSQCLFSQGTTNGGQQNTTMGYNNGLAIIHNWPSPAFTSGTTVVINKPNVIEFNYDQSATLRNTLLQGTSLGTTNTSGSPLNLLGTSIIGAHAALPGTRFFNGDLGEIIAYTDFKNSTDRSKIQSYLAIKYGTTLSNAGGGANGDYVSSAGTTIWDADNKPAYHHNVIGIGRDDASALVQKQSHQVDDSVRIYVSTLSDVNLDAFTVNNGSFSTDQQFVLAGDNDGLMRAFYNYPEKPSGQGLYSRIDREWEITNTGFTGTFAMDFKLNTTPITASDLRLLVDSDGDFTNATVYTPTITYSGGVVTVSGINNTMIPAGSTRYLTIASVNSSTPLPITLKEFTARPVDNKYVQLNWQTATEINNDYFTIERSADGVNWQEIGRVKGAGNSSQLLSYSFVDANPLTGVSYYRLRQTDFDNHNSVSSVRTVVINFADDSDIKVYPNPSPGEIRFNSLKNISSIIVYTATGAVVKQFQNINAASLKYDLSNLPNGYYTIRLIKSNGEFVSVPLNLVK